MHKCMEQCIPLDTSLQSAVQIEPFFFFTALCDGLLRDCLGAFSTLKIFVDFVDEAGA